MGDLPHDYVPELVLYVTTGTETSPGMLYQVADTGRVMGKVPLPYTATGIALHRGHGLVLAVPREGGKLYDVDDTGKLSTLLEKDPAMPHPIRVGIAGQSDTIVVADNIANQLAATSIGGTKGKVYQRFDGSQYSSQDMSVAVTNDKHVMFSSPAVPGVFRFSGDESPSSKKPVLPVSGGVAADPKSLRWAACQDPNTILVYEGEELVKKLRLPPGKSFYRNGLLSFSPAGSIIVAVRDEDKQVGDVWFLCYDIDKDDVRSLFPWKFEQMQDFTSGPRMLWNRHSPSGYKSTY
ncbi:MAG: hypothetical protein ABR915_22635 [Thermoguttaceae bacterium]|jgi:hypothetical protein